MIKLCSMTFLVERVKILCNYLIILRIKLIYDKWLWLKIDQMKCAHSQTHYHQSFHDHHDHHHHHHIFSLRILFSWSSSSSLFLWKHAGSIYIYEQLREFLFFPLKLHNSKSIDLLDSEKVSKETGRLDLLRSYNLTERVNLFTCVISPHHTVSSSWSQPQPTRLHCCIKFFSFFKFNFFLKVRECRVVCLPAFGRFVFIDINSL